MKPEQNNLLIVAIVGIVAIVALLVFKGQTGQAFGKTTVSTGDFASGKSCTSDAQCPKGEICRDGRCISILKKCTSDADCNVGQEDGIKMCIDGKCI